MFFASEILGILSFAANSENYKVSVLNSISYNVSDVEEIKCAHGMLN